MTPFQKHVKQWSNCQLCDLCEKRDKVVLCRGKLPCDVLFVGEAPGPSEDAIGLPFVGPAGHLLDEMINDACYSQMESVPYILRMAFTNLVACIPKDENNQKFLEPPEYAIDACSPRLEEIIRLANPKLIVLVGKLAKKHIAGYRMPDSVDRAVEIIHPAAILRADVAQRSLAIKRTIVTLADAFTKLT